MSAAAAVAEADGLPLPAESPAGAAAPPAQSAAAENVPGLYVGDLHPGVRDENLFEFFATVGPVGSVRVCRDNSTGRSLGYGYVNYIALADASAALEKLNHAVFWGQPIRVMWSNRDPDAWKSGVGNVFVKNLSDSVDNARLHDLFSKYGAILSCKVARNEDGTSRRYGFVQFQTENSANAAIEELNNSSLDGKQLYVASFVKRSERLANNPDDKYTNLYVKNLDQDFTEELMKLKFSEFGTIVSVKLVKDENGNPKGFGFVSFESPESAKKAKEAMDGLQIGSKNLYVARAQKKSERQQYLQHLYEEKRNEKLRKTMGSNLYVKNINDTVDENTLREWFGECGNITSAKIMRDEKGISRGFGFVCYSTPDEAQNAMAALHGKMFHGKPLFVVLAQRKEERRAQLQHQFARLAALAGSPGPMIPAGYSTVYYPAAAAASVVPRVPLRQGGIMYQPLGLAQGWRPGPFVPPPRPAFQPIPSPVMPNTPRQQKPNRGRTNGHLQYTSHPQSHPFTSTKDSYYQRYGNARTAANGRHRDGMVNGSAVPRSPSNSTGTDLFSSMLAAVPLEEQKQMLGDRLFPLVEKLQPDLAKKITGMLLEMDNSEVLVLLYTPELLSAKVEEAVHVLELAKPLVGSQEGLRSKFLLGDLAASS